MIYTVTLNPAIDYAMHVDNLTAGQVNRSHGEYVYMAEKELMFRLYCIILALKV